MRDLKIKPGMDTPKAKQKNPAPKDAESILKSTWTSGRQRKNRKTAILYIMLPTVWRVICAAAQPQPPIAPGV